MEAATFGFQERIAAAADATVAAAAQVRAVIGSEVDAMGTAWSGATEEANTAEAQATAITSVVNEYREKLDRFRAVYRDREPSGILPASLRERERQAQSRVQPGSRGSVTGPGLSPSGPTQNVVRRSAEGWTVADEVVARLRNNMHGAQSAAAEVSRRMFSGRQRQTAEANAESVEDLLNSLEAEVQRLHAVRAGSLERREQEASTLRSAADLKLTEATGDLREAMRRLPPAMTPWTNPSWLSWSPVLTHSHVLLGMLRPQITKLQGINHSFGWDIRIPVFLSVRGAVEIAHRRSARDSALALVRSVLLRALACTPPGKLRLSVFDPTGLGQSIANLLELGEYDRDLIGGKVWSSTDDLHRVLAEHTAHVELVIQKYLRAEYASLDAFNAAAGEIAEPYRLLVIFDAPSGFDERTVNELRRIIENGPRCGVATLLVTDEELDAPYGVSLDGLREGLRRIRLHVPFTDSSANAAVAFELLPDSDAGASPPVVTSIVEQVGKSAQEATSSAVSFERCFGLFVDAAIEGHKRGLPRLTTIVKASDPETWWSQTTIESVAAPIGLRGARDVATLTFDSSDHSGALLVGRPGSGKSTLLHTYIAGITTLYGPDELELHLIDFKEGVEFKVYAAGSLPHARTVAIESDREFGVSVLQAIEAELAWRGSLLRGSESHSSLETLRKATGERLPRIVLIFDEFQVLFARNDKLGSAAAEALETLIRQGRGFGIHVLLGSQSLAGLDALGSHVPQLLPVRILLPAADGDAFRVLGEGNVEGTALTTAGEGILNPAGGVVEGNERFRGAAIEEDTRRDRVAAMRTKADSHGFQRRPVVFEGNAPIPAEDMPPERFLDEIRGADSRTLRLRFGSPMAIAGNADINLRRESGANILVVARNGSSDTGPFSGFSAPRAVVANMILSAAAQRGSVELVDFLPIDEGLESFTQPLLDASLVRVNRRRQVPELLTRIRDEVAQRVAEDDTNAPAILLALFGMHRARDFDQEAVDYDAETDLPELLVQILRDGPEVGVHTLLWFDTIPSIGRRLPPSAAREVSWRLAGKMSADDSSSFLGVDTASSLREQQVLAANEDRGVLQRCTLIAAPSAMWTQELVDAFVNDQKEPE